MDWKNFFKPTKWKIVLTLTFLLIFQIVPTIPCYNGLTTGEPDQRYGGSWKICSMPGPLNIWKSMGNYYDYFGFKNSDILAVFYVIIISYLISSIILSKKP